MVIHETVPPIKGLVRLSQVLVGPDGKPLARWFKSRILTNQVCYDWGTSAAALFRNLQDGKQYHIAGMYLEFDNSGADVNPVPSIDRDTTASYYRELSGDSDFLRVPLIATSGANTDSDLFTGDNQAVFYAQSAGTEGNRTTSPLEFSDSAGSRVYGAALVAFRDPDDSSEDLVISRIYFDPGDQVEKVAGSQIHVTWALTFA